MKNSARINDRQRLNKGDLLLCLLVFIICLTGAFLLPMEQCPDERGRQLLTDFIANNGRLPRGDEPEVIIGVWGFSYALRPYLSSLISAGFGKITMAFTHSPVLLRPAYRMGSVLSTVLTAVYSLKTGKLLFGKTHTERLFASIIVFLPQVLFLGMYLNNDSLSLLAVALCIYYYLIGRQTHWNLKSCIGLGLGFSIAFLSYYTIYGWILVTGVCFLISLLREKARIPYVLRRLSIVAGICIILAGWFFVRNAVIHNGDIFGLATENTALMSLKDRGVEPLPYLSLYEKGCSFSEFLMYKNGYFLKLTTASFFGCFGYMKFPLPLHVYALYCLYFGFGIVMYCVCRFRNCESENPRNLLRLMVCSCLITLCLHVYSSYVRDMQPQGRYIITFVILFAYMIVRGITYFAESLHINAEYKRHVPVGFNAIYLLLMVWSILGTMSKMLVS